MPTSTIALPNDFVANILSTANGLISSMSGYEELIVGVLLGMIVLGFIIGMLKR